MVMPLSSNIYLFFLYCLFSILLGLAIFHLRFFSELIKRAPKKLLVSLLLVLAVSLSLRIVAIPHRHIVYYDEFQSMNVAQNIAYHNIYGATRTGDTLHPEKFSPYARPGGYPFLLSIFYRLFGTGNLATFLLTSLLGGLSAGTIFLAVYLLFKKIPIALWSGFLTGIFPVHLKYSGCASGDISSFFFLSLGFLILLLFNKTKKLSLLYLSTSLFVFASYIRPENALFFVVLIIFILRSAALPKKERMDWLFFLGALSLPLLIQIIPFCLIENRNANAFFWSLRFLRLHFFDNLRYLFSYSHNFLPATLFAILGLSPLYRLDKKMFHFLTCFFLFCFIAYSGFFSGLFYKNYDQINDRYFILCAFPIIIFASIGIHFFLNLFKKSINVFLTILLLFIFTFSAFYVNSLFVPKAIAQKEPLHPTIAEYFFVKNFLTNTGNDLYVIAIDPSAIIVDMHKKGLSINFMEENSPLPQKAHIFKQATWDEKEFDNYINSLKSVYRIVTLAEKSFWPGTRTIISEITKSS